MSVATRVTGLVLTGLMSGFCGLSGAADRPDGGHLDAAETGCVDCHFPSSLVSLAQTTSGHSSLLCTDCHDPHGETSNLYLTYELLETPSSGIRAVVFTDTVGMNSYADGDAVYDGICEVCHTTTLYHRNDGSGDHGHYAATDCTICHPHYGFQPPVGGVGDVSPGFESLRVSPNPSTGPVTITFSASGIEQARPGRLVVYDVHGRVLERSDLTILPGGNVAVWSGLGSDGQAAVPGVYFLRVESERNRTTVKYIVIR